MSQQWTEDIISPDRASCLHALLLERVKRTPDAIAYRYFDRFHHKWMDLSWSEVNKRIKLWKKAMEQENFNSGDRVGVMMRNCPEWIIYEHAALRLGLVLVPLYPNDRPDNIAHIVNEANIKLMLIESIEQWKPLNDAQKEFEATPKLISIDRIIGNNTKSYPVTLVSDWLAGFNVDTDEPATNFKQNDPDSLATIVYTSGTTGKPKGVMLSHRNIVLNANYGIKSVTVFREDLFLSFLPLSHTLERTVGLYIPMMAGATVAFARSIPLLAEDLVQIKPTVLISVPRIFERVYAKIQTQLQEKAIGRFLFNSAVASGWAVFENSQDRESSAFKRLFWPILKALVAKKVLAKLGGRLRFAISGGAPLSTPIAKTFIGLGVNILQGYGLTESSPVISVNKIKKNFPASIGLALWGVEVRVSIDDELQSRGPCVMSGYWKNESATKEMFTEDGWLKTGDLARIDENGFIFITGRKKEIMVMSNGEKVPPVDMEMAITLDSLVEQAMIIGEGKPFLSAIVVLNPDEWRKFAGTQNINPYDKSSLSDKHVISAVLERIAQSVKEFPGYAQVRVVTLTLDAWTDENGLLTASLKMRRNKLMEKYENEITKMYAGH